MKNAIYKIISSIRQKWVAPRVYGIVLKVKGFQQLSLQSAYSLEEAIIKAKKELLKNKISGVSNYDVDMSKIDMFCHIETEELFADYFENKMTELTEEPKNDLTLGEKKNLLMKRIVETKDLKLLEENRSVFSKAEVEYLTGEINKK